MSEMIPASILLEKAKFDSDRSVYKMPRLYEHIDRVDLWPQAQQAENARLMPLLELAVKIIEVQDEALDKAIGFTTNSFARNNAIQAQAKVQEILGGME